MAVTSFPTESPLDSVKQTIRSTSTCTPATVLSLQTLFRSAGEIESATGKKAGRATKATVTTTTTSRAKTARSRTTTKTKQPVQDVITSAATGLADARISSQEKLVLATEVFNTTLKTLSDAVKTTSKEKKETSPVKRGTKGRSRTTPLEERNTAEGDGVSAVAECARLSLSCLRTLKAETGGQGDGMPNLQLEQGACVLAGRLLAIGLNDLAYKELRGLKRRIQQYLDGLSTGKKKAGKETRDGEVEEGKERMSDLLSFTNVSNAGSVHGLLVTFQSNALRLIAAEKRPATIQKLVPSLQLADDSSPANVILAAMESGALARDKAAMQLQLLSGTVSSLTAQSASNAKERLKPITTLTLQLLSLEIRCLSWKTSGHTTDDNKEMWDPLARYVGGFAQATKSIEKTEFATIYKSIVRLQSAFAKTQNRTTRPKDNLSVARIATILGQLAQDAGCYDEALQLFSESLNPLANGQCLGLATVRCKIGTLHFQAIKASTKLSGNVSEAVSEAADSLSLPLKGTSHDLDELLIEAAKLKKQALSWYGDRASKARDSTCEGEVFPRTCEYLNAFVRFLRRYIGRRPADDEVKDQEAFQKRIDAAQNIVLAAVDSTVAIGKLSVMSQTPAWDDIIPTLLDCQRLLTTIEPEETDLDDDSIGMGLVKLSNLFWSRYLKVKEAGKGARGLLPLLKQSANLLSECSPSQRVTGFAPLKFERLAHTYIEAGGISEGEQAFCQSLNEHIAAGALDKTASVTEGLFPHQISQDPKTSGFTLGRVLSAYLKVKLRNKRSAAEDVFDDDSLPAVQRGHMLEWQLGVLTDIHGSANIDIFRSVFGEITTRLLEVYSHAQHPIRRLRVVLCGLRFALEQPRCLDPSAFDKLVDEGIEGLGTNDCHGDSDIATLATHLKNSVRLTLGLHQGSLGPERLNIIVSTWSSMLQKCHDLKALLTCVGNVDYCLLQMKAVVDYTEIHGIWKYQLSTLELVLRVTELQGEGAFSEGIIVLSRLVLQYCRLGSCNKAHSLLTRAEGYTKNHEVSCLAKLSYDLARVSFLLETGEPQKAATVLSVARMLYEKNQTMEDLNACSVLTKISWERLVADAAFMNSRLSFAQGSIKDALFFAKLAVRLNCRIWAKVEKLAQKKQEKAVAADSSELEVVVEGMAKLEVSQTSSTYSQGAPFWPHIGSHHSSLLHLANLSAHHGLFQDAIYYGEQALKINKSLNANVRLIASQAQLGSHWILGGHISQGQELLSSAKELAEQLESSIEVVSLRLSLAALHRVEGDHRHEYRTLREAEKLLAAIMESDPAKDSATELEEKMDQLRIRPKSRSTRQTASTATRRTRSTTTARSPPKPPPSTEPTSIESNTILHVKSEILRQQAASLRSQSDFEKALNLLSEARKCAVTRDSKISINLGESEHLLADAIRSFATHAVYCVLPESTISLPSLQGSRPSSEASSSKSTARRTKAPTRTRAKAQPAVEEFSVMLSKAGDCLNDIFQTATHLGSTLDSHSASRLMSRVSMLSHVTASQTQVLSPQSPATMNEIGRIGAFARERAAISIDKQLADYCDPLLWPRSEFLESDSISSDFTREYIDILPENCNVLSLSLSADQTEFVVSRLHQGRSPFLLRLPLRRGNSEDEEEEQFTFEDGRDEMKELIQLANESAHAAKLQVDRQAKKEWWKNREALDGRMENLLQNIENVWFGGFRGIFSPIPNDDKSLERFANSFETILDKHLPSRQKGSRAEGPRLTLHSNVMELFVGVKNLEEQEDPEDTLMDLLYFVVDILQFQGERNAYDEVDFDMMVVETLDAVRVYHENAKEEARKPNNTVLVLDKSLHLFPWESLPCLQGLPVCRVPSLECLRDRVLQFRSQNGLGIDRRNGTYVLNPTGDLHTTQNTFEKDLSNVNGWNGLVNRLPTEDEFKDSLESKSLFLYFGHGSGAQYIRGRTIKRLDQCAVTFLMGCSSGTLTEAGEYEPYGTPMNYLQAGSPALVATLWDVTDKDIDRFAKSTFEHWGLLGDKACGEDVGDEDVSLDAAVSQSRRACVLKYLNGAAPVVYGVPGVFLE